ncbi:MAG: 16S rRNA (guanine(966)-N(2))-methyltransferase RsmD [Candidatus Omnitrophica bacterium]|nr:16S rRNA (guanine(966)-N(2))-methyltransferase RsmD [Candidatus Omnitrophota bacterium]
MRIVSGKLKGRKLVAAGKTRPVSERIRKSCFDILADEVQDKKVLDLFAGSGALGLEALSRGAKECIFVDSSNSAKGAIKKNILSLNLEAETELYLKDAFLAIEAFYRRQERFSLVFLDPPYYRQMLTKALQRISEYDIVCPSGYLVAFCYEKDDFVTEISGFSLKVNKKYGQTVLLIYVKA